MILFYVLDIRIITITKKMESLSVIYWLTQIILIYNGILIVESSKLSITQNFIITLKSLLNL